MASGYGKKTASLVTNGLVMHLDAGNSSSYSRTGSTWTDLSGNGNHATLYNSPTYNSLGYLTFNGTNQYARTANTLNLSSFNAVTIEIFYRAVNPVISILWEHTANWNSNAGGMGLAPHCNGGITEVNTHHTNHYFSVGANDNPMNYNFSNGTLWSQHVNQFSRVTDATGRLIYGNGSLIYPAPYFARTSSSITGPGTFANDHMYLASRGGISLFSNSEISVFRVYNRKLTASEIAQNFSYNRSRFGI